MADSIVDNKRIAKNSLMLYIRMFFIMAIQFFTFRELLATLGVDDYGMYNVVGGVVILFSFLNTAMTNSSQRYLSYGIGKGDNEYLRKTFSTCVILHFILAICIVILAETIGLWFLNSEMKFPLEKMSSVNVVYQFSIFTFAISTIQVPYTASIISYEKMHFYAIISILDVFLKLSIVLSLFLFTSQRVSIYAGLLLLEAFIIYSLYKFFCKRRFSICNFKFIWDKNLVKEIASFSGWNMAGGLANVGASQGVNIMFNIFCGVAVNAAMGITHQVTSAVSSFFTNVQIAFNPQIVKSYASADKLGFVSLVFRSSRICFFLAFLVGFPVIANAEFLLTLWLTEVPLYAASFVQLMVSFCIIDAMSSALWIATQASGKIKIYMLIISCMIFSNVPVSYMLLKLGLSPIWVIFFRVLMNFIIHIYRIFFLKISIQFPSGLYLRKVMLPIILLVAIAIPLPLIMNHFLQSYNNLYISFLSILVSIIETIVIGYYLLLTKNERLFVCNKVKEILLHVTKH